MFLYVQIQEKGKKDCSNIDIILTIIWQSIEN